MQALDAAGRRWEALDAYDRLRQTLEDELRRLARSRPPSAAPPAARGPVRHGSHGQQPTCPRAVLPSSADVASWPSCSRPCDRTRLLTLSGPGGVGKTRLAVELGTPVDQPLEHPDGVWMVDLSGLRDGCPRAGDVATTLGLADGNTTRHRAAGRQQLADPRC